MFHGINMVLERIRIEEEEEKNKEEAIFLCWRGFLFRNINAAKNKPTTAPDVFHLGRHKRKWRQRKETMTRFWMILKYTEVPDKNTLLFTAANPAGELKPMTQAVPFLHPLETAS